MPMYEYHCESNGRLVEVQHKMGERLLTWGELCERAGISADRTDPQAKVEKLMSAGFINAGSSPAAGATCEAPGCGAGACGGGFCGGGDLWRDPLKIWPVRPGPGPTPALAAPSVTLPEDEDPLQPGATSGLACRAVCALHQGQAAAARGCVETVSPRARA